MKKAARKSDAPATVTVKAKRMSGWDFATWRVARRPVMRSTIIGLLLPRLST